MALSATRSLLREQVGSGSSNDIDQAIYHVANALQIPVLILALLALAAVIYEFGAYLIELRGRRRRVFSRISASAEQARRALFANDRSGAAAAASGVARSQVMADTLAFIVKNARTPGGDRRPQPRPPRLQRHGQWLHQFHLQLR